MKSLDLANVEEAGNGSRLKAGGYICKITSVQDNEAAENLYIEFDIAEGENKGYYKKLEESFGFWGGKFWQSYKEKSLPFFKRLCSAVSKSNAGFIFDGKTNADEQTMVGKLIGIVLQEEEYVKNNGDTDTRLVVAFPCSVESIRKGDYKVPAKKLLPASEASTSGIKEDANGFIQVPDNELPYQFN